MNQYEIKFACVSAASGGVAAALPSRSAPIGR